MNIVISIPVGLVRMESSFLFPLKSFSAKIHADDCYLHAIITQNVFLKFVIMPSKKAVISFDFSDDLLEAVLQKFALLAKVLWCIFDLYLCILEV